MATLSLLACGSLAWMAARRGWSPRPAIWMRVVPVLSMVAGAVWIGLLVPAWPGVLLVAAGVVALMWGWLTTRRDLTVEAATANRALASTVYRPQP